MSSATHNPIAGGDEKPARCGRYTVVRELGKGGMAHVFEGRHAELGSRVALKVMQPTLAAQPLAAGRFLREAKAASQIRHPNVVEVFDIGTENGLPFIVMEFLDGSNLATLLGEKGPLSLSGIVDVFLPVISAVATAHAAGIIHRDLKPANLMITRRPPRGVHPMVLDFGISKITNEELEGTFTRSESLLGTVQYMAPELTRGAKFASTASDQYALGVMLYECATGRRPFVGASHYELMHAIVTAPVEPPSRLQPGLSPEFDALVERAMHRDPTKRFPSVAALGSALLSFGDRTAWALWEREFTGLPRESEPWAAAQGTLHDDPSAAKRDHETRFAPARPRKGRNGGWLLAPLSIYAVIVTVLLARRAFEKDGAAAPSALPLVVPAPLVGGALSPTRLPGAVATAATIRATPEALGGDDSILTGRAPTASLEPEPLAAAAPPGASQPVRSNARSAKTSFPGIRPPSSAAPEASTTAPLRAARPEPAVVVGTNGAPIVD